VPSVAGSPDRTTSALAFIYIVLAVGGAQQWFGAVISVGGSSEESPAAGNHGLTSSTILPLMRAPKM
jgi:hypothetical protein